MMIAIEPHGTSDLLPAIVVGFEVPEVVESSDLETLKDTPEWTVMLSHQAGGLCMRYPEVVGGVLRLDDNKRHGIGDIDQLIKGFRAIGEDPNRGRFRSFYADLFRFCKTWGEDYSESQLCDLDRTFSEYLRLPPIESGIEAFLRFDQCDPFDFFRGWSLTRINAPERPRRVLYKGQLCPHFDDSNFGELRLEPGVEFQPDVIAELERLGRQIGQSQVRAFLLWENSD